VQVTVNTITTITGNGEQQQRRSKMSDQETRNPQQSVPQKPEEKKPVTQPNVPVQPKQEIPTPQPKPPQPEQEKHDQEKKKFG